MFTQVCLIPLYSNTFSPFSFRTVRLQVPQPREKKQNSNFEQFSIYVLLQKTG